LSGRVFDWATFDFCDESAIVVIVFCCYYYCYYCGIAMVEIKTITAVVVVITASNTSIEDGYFSYLLSSSLLCSPSQEQLRNY
jgi:hypothetical protein